MEFALNAGQRFQLMRLSVLDVEQDGVSVMDSTGNNYIMLSSSNIFMVAF
jgi:hypothetical protein